ncbi:hypothetical protein PLICRDRAFT_112999 [Plicaturopsis crispa FD-325 SS-3]|nr:hypothetical protein PLICRDRAFT_112999 [Plicaturopsis crispa FD-325 SS-3]
MFKPDRPTQHTLPNLADGLIPLFPMEGLFTITESRGKRITIRRRQLAIMAGYAFTDFKSQGQTLERLLADIGKVSSGSLNPFNAYVALSRSRGRDTIRLLRDFDDKLFTQHPSEDLRVEDARLEALASETLERWKAGMFEL